MQMENWYDERNKMDVLFSYLGSWLKSSKEKENNDRIAAQSKLNTRKLLKKNCEREMVKANSYISPIARIMHLYIN